MLPHGNRKPPKIEIIKKKKAHLQQRHLSPHLENAKASGRGRRPTRYRRPNPSKRSIANFFLGQSDWAFPLRVGGENIADLVAAASVQVKDDDELQGLDLIPARVVAAVSEAVRHVRVRRRRLPERWGRYSPCLV